MRNTITRDYAQLGRILQTILYHALFFMDFLLSTKPFHQFEGKVNLVDMNEKLALIVLIEWILDLDAMFLHQNPQIEHENVYHRNLNCTNQTYGFVIKMTLNDDHNHRYSMLFR